MPLAFLLDGVSWLMKILVQNCLTHLFLKSLTQWTANPAEAETFPSSENAILFCAKYDIPAVQIVLKFDPDRYDITRRVSGHVGFGAGIHMCVGQLLARLEGEVLISALARKVSTIDFVSEPERRYNNTLRGLDSLPVTFTAA